MSNIEIKQGTAYRTKVIGMEGIREIQVTSILTNVVTCVDVETKESYVARICDLEQR